MALLSVGQHVGRPYIPTDQAWIETLWGHVRAENPHLLAIDDPRSSPPNSHGPRGDYNHIRLHEGIGYVTPDDEHAGRGEQIRQAPMDESRRFAAGPGGTRRLRIG